MMLEKVVKARVYWLALGVLAFMAAVAPHFATAQNVSSILKGTSVNVYAAIGFTLVLVTGQLDLSVGAVMTLGGMMAIGLQPRFGWVGSFAAAAMAGGLVGLFNGVLVAKGRIHSFIVTLGTMTILSGVVNLYSHGGTLFVSEFGLAEGLNPAGWVVTPQVMLALAAIGVFGVLLKKTPWGRAFYLIGGNPQTAWFAGVNVPWMVAGAFVVSGVLCGMGGALFAASLSSVGPTMGDKSLMLVIAAVIIGGTSMRGGKGSVVESGVALLTLTALINGLGCLGAGFEAQLIASGAVLAVVVLYDAWHGQGEARVRGRRPELMKALAEMPAELLNEENESPDRSDTMAAVPPPPHRDRTFALACMTMTACVAIVAIYALATRPQPAGAPVVQYVPAPAGGSTGAAPGLEKGVDVMALKGSDGQPLIALDNGAMQAPPRPADPKALPEEDAGHWYDMEYAGWATKKVNPVPVPAANPNGAKGKRVVCLRSIDHPYFTAYTRGMQQVADAYGIQLKTLVANGDINLQSQQVDQVINEKADLVIITPVDATAVVPLLKRLNDGRVPVIASNLIPIDQGMPYVMAWTGPDDWGQMRVLAREFAKRMNYEGGYAIVRHVPGGSPFFSRTFGVITELKKIAPKMKCLDMQPTGLKAEETMQTVSGWITRFGPELKGIVSADDSGAQTGIAEACKNAKRTDIVCVAAGNSKVGMDFVKSGELAAITCQSAEGDGALPMKLAGDFFQGKAVERPVYYLKKSLITKENVEQYLPPQW